MMVGRVATVFAVTLCVLAAVRGTQAQYPTYDPTTEPRCLTDELYALYGDAEKETDVNVKIAISNWDASALNGYTAQILLWETMGINSTTVESTSEAVAFELLESGEYDAFLELWGNLDVKDTYVNTRRTVQDAGNLGVIGRIGWYVPKYMLTKVGDDLNSHHAYKYQKNVDWFVPGFNESAIDSRSVVEKITDVRDAAGGACATGTATQCADAILAEVNSGGSGQRGLFYGAGDGWTHYDKQQIDNNRLLLDHKLTEEPLETNLIAELRTDYERGAGHIMYFWTPHQLFSPLSDMQLARVSLPETSDECIAKNFNFTHGGIDCDYPPDFLGKLTSGMLPAKSQRADQFFKRFTLRTNDQVDMLANLHFLGRSAREAACEWINANPDEWRQWRVERVAAVTLVAGGGSVSVGAIVGGVAGGLVVLGLVFALYVWMSKQAEKRRRIADQTWRLDPASIEAVNAGNSKVGSRVASRISRSRLSQKAGSLDHVAQMFCDVAMCNGEVVAVKGVRRPAVTVTDTLALEIYAVREARTCVNLSTLVGVTLVEPVRIITEYCSKGSLQDVLLNTAVELDWMFKFSLATDVAKGLRYLHNDPVLRAHGHLSTPNCVVDSRWVCKITDFGMTSFTAGQAPADYSDHQLYSRALWTAPELIDAFVEAGTVATAALLSPAGDAYGYGMILHDITTRDLPYSETGLEPREIVEKVRKGGLAPKLTDDPRCPGDVLNLIRQCLGPAERRPTANQIVAMITAANPNKNTDVMDNMLKMLETYANHLEDIVEERTKELQEEKKKTEQLLYRMLPRSVADSLKMGAVVAAETFEESTIFFSDIVGFTKIASLSTPMQVVDLLNDLYTCFDAIIDEHDVYKVETIGDAYMVVSGIPIRNGNRHSGEISNMALDLLSATTSFQIRHQPETQLQLRIGLHSGPAVAGVVGLKMPRYCLFGDTVNTASRMESGGLALRIHLSPTTAKGLKALGGYKLDSRGEIEVKGKGRMETFWLLGRDGFNKPMPDLARAAGKEEHEFK